MHLTLLALTLASPAFASSHEDTLGSNTSDTSFEDECWVDVVTATKDVLLTKAEAYVDENDSSASPKVYMYYWTRVGTGAWSRSTALGSSITVTSSSAAWVSTTTLNVGITAGTTYAIGYCTSYTIDGYYSTSTSWTDPSWGTYEGYDWMNSTDPSPSTTYTSGKGVYIRLTVSAADTDHDGYDSIDDCDDADSDVYPNAPEIWYDGVDQDCLGGNDYDQDGDGYDVESHGGDDCDDTDESVNPSGETRDVWYDGVDSDCRGNSDYDQDGDGDDSSEYGGGDCDDRNPDINSDVDEQWYDGVDQDCDGESDYDQDGDGYDAQSAGGEDCDDTNPALNVDCSGDNGGENGGNGGDDTAADDTGGGPNGGGGANGGTEKSGCGKDDSADSGEKKGCCGGGSAMMLTTLLWTLTKRRRSA